MRTPKPLIVAGPFETEREAIDAWWDASWERLDNYQHRYTKRALSWRWLGRAWYVIERATATVHAGNKKWRRLLRDRRRARR